MRGPGRFFTWAVCVAVASAPAAAAPADPKASGALPDAARGAVAGRNAFTIDLLRQATRSSERANLAVAPAGLAELLALLRTGAAGRTAAEIDKVLHAQPGAPADALRALDPARPTSRATVGLDLANNDGYGVRLMGVPAGSPGALLGLEPGDLVLSADGVPVRSRARLDDLAFRKGAGSLRLQVYRFGPGVVAEFTLPLTLERGPGSGIAVARSVWVQSGAAVPDAFVAAARDRFGAELLTADFRHDEGSARGAVAAWLARPLLGDGATGAADPAGGELPLGPDTRLLLLDRFAMDAPWARPFPPATPGDFRTAEGKSVRLDTMAQEATYPAAEVGGVAVVELPFNDGRRGLLLALPTDPAVPPESVEAGTIAAAVAAMKPAVVAVSLPKFRLERASDLGEDLAALGMPRAFTDDAEFPGLDPRDPLKLGAVRQTVALAVDEAGARAEAATVAAAVTIRGDRKAPLVFKADRPFLFFVIDRPTGLFLLAGVKYR